MVTGSCLCGKVRWTIDGPLTDMTHCHCSMCRKAHGAPFATYAMAARDAVTWLSGEDSTATWESSPGIERAFCVECGSVVPSPDEHPEVEMPVGGLDGDPGARPQAHIFAASAAPWHVFADSLPRHDTWPAMTPGPVVEQPPRDGAGGGVLHGSCLCDAIAYEAKPSFRAVHNCHCSRCRKARAAAHTTNGFVALEDLAFTRGEERLKIWRLPGARYFAQAFCTGCGSIMPRHDPARGVAVIPFGSLDSDPGCGAEDHIFVGFRAPWYEIDDHLPQFEGMPP